MKKIKLLIYKIENGKYFLENNETKEKYEFNLTFFDLKEDLKPGDYIFFSKKLLDPSFEEYSSHYYFGSIDEVYGREVISKDDIELIKIKQNNKTIYLKRFFG